MVDVERPRVLVVDDEEGVRETTVAILSEDYTVESAADATEALTLLESNPFDIVCSDLQMPGMNGLELLSIVAEKPGHIGRVLVTGYREMVDTSREKRAGTFIVIKPYDPDKLIETVNRAWHFVRLRRSMAHDHEQTR